MGDTRDFLEQEMNVAIDEMEEISILLEELCSKYEITLEDKNSMKDLIIEKGLDIVKLHSNIESLQDSLENCLKKNN